MERAIPLIEAERDTRKRKGDVTWTGMEALLNDFVIMVTWRRHKLGLPLNRPKLEMGQ